jgi:Immunity protein 31
MKYDFDSEVVVLPTTRLRRYAGRKGVVAGIGEDEGHGASYAVAFPNEDMLVSFWEWELEGTGAKVSREDARSGEPIKVRVKDDGSGEVVS